MSSIEDRAVAEKAALTPAVLAFREGEARRRLKQVRNGYVVGLMFESIGRRAEAIALVSKAVIAVTLTAWIALALGGVI